MKRQYYIEFVDTHNTYNAIENMATSDKEDGIQY